MSRHAGPRSKQQEQQQANYRWRCTRSVGRASATAVALAALVLLSAAGAASAATPAKAPAREKAVDAHPHGHFEHACVAARADLARCFADIVTTSGGTPFATGGPAGYGPSDLLSAYNLAAAAAQSGGTQTVAIVDAFDDPNAEADLAVYRSQYGLSACTTANGCFRKVNETGGTSYPSPDTGWSEEISLDLDMVSAICPKCKVLLVEASSNTFSDLGASVDEAATLGATQISNSYGNDYRNGQYGGSESDYDHPGIAITASSGDYGYGVSYPASSQYVTAVGGTALSPASNQRGWSESAWTGAGSGCSTFVAKPSWQTDSGCSNRTVADVSAVADPNTGVAVYDTYNVSGWLVFGGTSASSPIIASYYALIGPSAATNYGSFAYSHQSLFNDITSGSNGSCGGTYLCQARTGYDGPTGIGTPAGVPGAAATLTASPASLSAGSPVTVSWSGVSSPTSHDWVGVYHPGDSNNTPLGRFYDNSCTATAGTSSLASGSCPFTVPNLSNIAGTYELRLFSNDSHTLLATSNLVTVGQAATTLTVNPTSLSAGSPVTVSWSGVSAPTSHDWVGVYHPGDPNNTPLGRFYDNSCTATAGTSSVASGSCPFTVPNLSNIAGTYVMRLFSNDGLTLLATSNPVTISGGIGSTARAARSSRPLPLRGGEGGPVRHAPRSSRAFPIRAGLSPLR